MEKLLFLVHRIPYPPNKGDKIRSYHFLKYLAEQYQVYLGTFIDDPNDKQYIGQLEALCAGICYQDLNPSLAKINSLKGLLTKQALSIPYYQNAVMKKWVKDTITQHNITKVLVFSGVMAQFVEPLETLDRIVDFVDVDSDKWRQYAENKRGLSRWIYAREAKYLLKYEQGIARQAKKSLFVSKQEAELFKQLAHVDGDKVNYVNNGVDTDYFSAHQEFNRPFRTDEEAIVFTGAMDYWANVDAVVWFAKEVLPLLAQNRPHAKFYIVGGKPSKEVRHLAENPHVVVTGSVPDVRPYLAHAKLAVAPLRIARGIQNKVLEAMAMAKQVVATTAAMEGIDYDPSLAVSVSDDPKAFAQLTDALLSKNSLSAGSNRAFIEAHFSWQENVRKLCGFLDE